MHFCQKYVHSLQVILYNFVARWTQKEDLFIRVLEIFVCIQFLKTMGIDLAKITQVWMHFVAACLLQQDSLLTTVLITEGLCPGKSSKRWKQR